LRCCHPDTQPSTSRQFLFHSFWFSKRGQMKPVKNLKKLNKWIIAQHFKMEGMGTLRELLRIND